MSTELEHLTAKRQDTVVTLIDLLTRGDLYQHRYLHLKI